MGHLSNRDCPTFYTDQYTMIKDTLLGKTPTELKTIAQHLGMPKFAGGQIASWIYQKHVTTIDDMSNISKANREKLTEAYSLGINAPIEQYESADGTIKYIFALHDGHRIESVYIPAKERATLCVSSQVGCKMNCKFCMTGKQGFQRNLTDAEIMNQILAIPESVNLTNIVFMGMGEPTDNPEAVLRAMDIITSDWGFAWSPKRVTLSTVGVKNKLARFLEYSKCQIAISLHVPDETRSNMMPANRSYPIEQLVDDLRQYDFSHQRRLSFEYIVFNGVNDRTEDANRLATLLKGIDCRVNLIKYHAIPNVDLEASPEEQMIKFRDQLNRKGITATIRTSRGEDILAACGMLSSKKR